MLWRVGSHLRACVCDGGGCVLQESEKRRIENAGGKVSWKRVDGDLAVSRALGDFYYKNRPDLPPEEQKVTACPEIQYVRGKKESRIAFCDHGALSGV